MMESRRLPKKNGKGTFKPASWASVYKLSTTKESNSQNSWYGWVIDFDKVLDMSKEAEKLLKLHKHFIKVLNKVIFLVK